MVHRVNKAALPLARKMELSRTLLARILCFRPIPTAWITLSQLARGRQVKHHCCDESPHPEEVLAWIDFLLHLTRYAHEGHVRALDRHLDISALFETLGFDSTDAASKAGLQIGPEAIGSTRLVLLTLFLNLIDCGMYGCIASEILAMIAAFKPPNDASKLRRRHFAMDRQTHRCFGNWRIIPFPMAGPLLSALFQ
ncbi:uncharacterized protein MYCFIDRAFT_173164 [Pseudocercospora fijiensis CIRAD86]|uniref:Uncharacterized protein n=1 Tax=Pseudocercospora fijiensis (strain CIRAD86) TaxID=383855 RepID=M3AHQ2_PSEFD|nr:uncharacterized protein MYCFIDRAFT_173164 [Pseudocercospora fijiensis CIRAD86]EME84116.1 hypothetical protein MYCFIDRAFT_173164 [Pseudocercospora fijiensis CIRAD86]